MTEGIIKNWNETVKDEDTVYVIGDFSFCNKTKTQEVFNSLKGTKILIKGNHDHKATLELPWKSVHDQFLLKYKDVFIWLCHYPSSSWERSYHGSWHLFGHVHNQGTYWANGLSCDVGMDLWDYKPVSFDTISSFMETLKPFREEYGSFLWRGKPFDTLQIVDFSKLEQICGNSGITC
jgi:calcineurin-like phosphoesterase family protein